MSGSARWCAWSVAALLACFLVSTLRPSCFVGLSSAFGKEPVCLFQAFVDGDLICCACTRAVGHSYQVPPHINLNGLLGRKNIIRRRLERLIALSIPERRRAGYRRWRHSHSRDLSGAVSRQTDIKRKKGMEAGGNTSSRDFKTSKQKNTYVFCNRSSCRAPHSQAHPHQVHTAKVFTACQDLSTAHAVCHSRLFTLIAPVCV